jgi:ureidoglycolate lyase
MTTPHIAIEPLTRDAFTPFGQVIEMADSKHFPINGGTTERYHDLAKVELGGVNPRTMISIFRGQPLALPLRLTQLERHPVGSQAFYPLSSRPFLVIVALDRNNVPEVPRAFRALPGQGVNVAMNTWHAALTALDAISDFIVVDRGGDGDNYEEFVFETPYTVG